ncbi:site-specific recombinase XerD [Kribbella orskensis]|uniref:Site-specific recombinase XerD n=1 Tax=Kribbella orskensis TaxID=2512216 RepID=A0ABY2B868_9ACTN|nr:MULTISPECIES: site-specific integrase [Kribbella]TCN28556.1 site-specific recombinase XerD [Kribbella sp. VKM Ac-2500]TCO08133.1 site-specific recombinase XerD [Kribbella orskensis]
MARRQFGSVRQLKSGRWQARYYGPDGIRREAPETFPRERHAKVWLTLREAEIVRGEWMDPDRGRELFGSYAARWIEQQKLGPRTREEYERIFRLQVEPFLGRRELGQVKPDTIRTWRSTLLTSGRSEDATAKAYRLVRSVMYTAVDDDLIRRNPCRIKGADKARRSERSVATVKQVYALADLLGERWRVFVLTAAFTGIRWGELISLRRTDVDLVTRVIRVPRAFAELSGGRLVVVPPKSEASERGVTIPEVLVGELAAHLNKYVGPDDEALVFVGERGGTPKRGSWRSTVKWTKRVAEAGLPAGFTFHDLRHTGSHLASMSGASTRELMQRMGHSTMRAALIYQHATDERAREIADRLNEVVERETKARDGGTPDDDDGTAGVLVPAP